MARFFKSGQLIRLGGTRLLLMAHIILLAAPGQAWGQRTEVSSNPFLGVVYREIQITTPRLNQIRVLEINPRAPGIRFALTPSNGSAPRDTTLERTRSFVDRIGAQAAVNAHSWYPPPLFSSDVDLVGLGVSGGVPVAANEAATHIFNITAANVASVVTPGADGTFDVVPSSTSLYNAVAAGGGALVRAGINVVPDYGDVNDFVRPQPRTAAGYKVDGTILLMTVDGRQTSWSQGLRLNELANEMLAVGAVEAVAFDGGGSTQMALDLYGDTGGASYVNRPSDGSNGRAVGTNLALHANPVNAVIAGPIPPVLVGRWRFAEGTGANTVNSVNSVSARLEGGATFGTLTDPFGGSNTVALGTGRYVDTMQGAPDLLPTTGSYSISAWGYITDAESANWTLVGAADNAGPTMGNALITGHASLNLARGEVFGPGYSPWVPTDWQGDIPANAWNHFVLVNDSVAGTVTIYVNGVPSLVSSYSGWPFPNPTGNWIFGGHQFFPGEIADVQFYTGVLSPAQITGVVMQGKAVGVSDYSDWLAGYPSLTGANTNGAADPDGDGFANMEEYAFGGDPTAGTPALMAVRSNGTNVVFNWLERSYGVTYEVQRSGTLTNWTAAAGLSIYNSADQSGVPMAPTYLRKEFVTNPSGTDFFRIRATVTGP